VIAPDYVWGDDDERAWRALGLRTVQAKEEQVDPDHPPVTLGRRLRKVLDRWWTCAAAGSTISSGRRSWSPTGPDPACEQGCDDATREVHAAWRAGRPGIIGVHRVQLSNLDPVTAAAGRGPAALPPARLKGARFLVDEEIRSLQATGRSRVLRGGMEIRRELRNGRLLLKVEPAGRAATAGLPKPPTGPGSGFQGLRLPRASMESLNCNKLQAQALDTAPSPGYTQKRLIGSSMRQARWESRLHL